MTRDHKYIKREGTPGNYKYIYDVKDAFSGFGKGAAKTFNSGVKAANTFGKTVASGTMKVTNNLRKDVKNAGSKLVMGTNGAVDKVKEATETGVQKAREAVGDGLIGAVEAVEPAAKSLDNMMKKVKNTAQKVIDDNKTVTKSGEEYTRLYRNGRIGSVYKIESIKGKKKDVQKFDKAYQTEHAKFRAMVNADDALYDVERKRIKANSRLYDYQDKEREHFMDDDWEKHDPEDMKKKYPHLAKNPGPKYKAIFETDSIPVSTPKAARKEFDEMMNAAEEYAKAKDHRENAKRHEALAEKVSSKAYEDYEKSGAKKRLQIRAKAN